ncbi:MAG TPA: hypothetical protein VFN49_07485 [Candidatus Aquilonibacter sp.]|nr:hypothetical protein [Candidatus Aquilonibacter sp.]
MNWKALIAASTLVLAALPFAAHADERPIDEMRWRSIGPALPEGRASAVVGSDAHPLLYYAGTAGGGAWKTTDGGASWENITDSIHLASVGAIGVNPANDNDVWIGAGETNPRNDVIPETGLYHSVNGGRSWKAVTFPKDAEGISRIIVDPSDPKHIVIGVLGNVFAPSSERGVYVSFDGGASFAKTLYVSDQAGASDIAMSPKDSKLLYAGMWHAIRRPWVMTSGSATDDGLYRSNDGGKTWSQVTGNGFPSAPIGRIGLAFAPSKPARIFALVESKDGVVWRSDDSGTSWKMVSKDSLADQRPFYFSHIRVSPTSAQTVYGVSMLLATSYDGGEKFNMSAFGVHPDLHDMWIASDGQRMALAGDGGIAISTNGGSNWSSARNLPIGQVYRVGLSDTTPYLICGGFQDNNGFCGPAFSGASGIANRDWFKVVEGDGEWAIPDPTDPHTVWADSENGEVVVYNYVSHDNTNVRPVRETAKEDFTLANSPYRFDWEAPIAFAAYDPKIAFIGANVVFETSNKGRTWKAISPDLTRNDKTKQQLAKEIVTQDRSGAENYATLLDIETSALHKGEIWTGSDDGLVHLTLDGGRHWRNVTPPALPADSAIETVAPSTLRDGTAYVSADRHVMGDRAAYLFVTSDFGAHWTSIGSGLPAGQYVRAVRPDIHNPNIVYAGTNRGMFVSCDRGSNWQSFQNNLPTVEIRDIRIQPRFDDMVIATHGRAIWVMDDLRPVQRAGCVKPTAPIVIGPRTVIALNPYSNDEGNYNDFIASQPAAGNGGLFGPNVAATVYYWLPKEAKTRPTIDVYDAKGHRVRHIEGDHDVFTGEDSISHWLSNTDGKNQFVYDMTVDGPVRYPSAPFFFRGPDEGPVLPPGHYTIAFHLDGKTYRLPVTMIADPLTTTTQAQFEAAFTQQRKVFDLLSRVDVMLNEYTRVRTHLETQKKTLKPGDANVAKLQAAVATIDARVAAITSNPQNFEDFIQTPGELREDVMNLMNQEPLAQASLVLYARLEREYTGRATAYNAWRAQISALNATLKSAGCKTVAMPVVASTKPAVR